MLRSVKYDQSWFYIEYSLYTHVLYLWIRDVNCSDTTCTIRLIISHLVRYSCILMKCVSVWFIWTTTLLFSSTNGCTIYCTMFSFHILDNFYILENFPILDFYINFYRLLCQAFYILEKSLIVSYFCTLSKIQFACLINIGKGKYIYRQ